MKGIVDCKKGPQDDSSADVIRATMAKLDIGKKAKVEEHLVVPDPKDFTEEVGEVFVNPFPRPPCGCGKPMCNADDPSPMWRCGIFMGAVMLRTGEWKKLDNPRDLLDDKIDCSDDGNLPGHFMSITELM